MNQDANSRPGAGLGKMSSGRSARFPRLQFRLRTLFLLTLALAVLCSWMSVTIASYKREARAYGTLLSQSGPLYYEFNHFWFEPLPKYAPSTIVIRLCVEEQPSVLKTAMLCLDEPERDLSVLSEFAHLDRLRLSGKVNDENIAHLTAVSNLNYLHIISSDVTDGSLKHLSNCRRLRKLHIHLTEITGSALADSPCLTNLQTLQISSEQLAQGGATLCSRLGNRLDASKTLGVWCRSLEDRHITAMSELPRACRVFLWPRGDGVLYARSDSYISDVVMSQLRARRPDIKIIVVRSGAIFDQDP